MKATILRCFLSMALALCWQVGAQNYDTNGDYVQTFAGSGFYGYLDGVGVLTMFYNPTFIVTDSHSNLFVWDSNNLRIREIAPDSTVTTFAGGGTQFPGLGTNAALPSFNGMAIDTNDVIWASAPSGYLYWLYNNGSVSRRVLTGVSFPSGVCVDSQNNVYVADSIGDRIYRFDTSGRLSIFAGSGDPGYADGYWVFTAFYGPTALACDAADNIYVWDSGNNVVRRIDHGTNVTTFAGKYHFASNLDAVGTNAGFTSIYQMSFDGAGNLLLACGDCIREITPSTNVITIAGNFVSAGYTNGPGNTALFNGADGICVSGGTIYLADTSNQRIRSITNSPTAQPVLPANLKLNTYPGLQITGTIGRTYQIQTSPDMSNWVTRATLILNSSPYVWIDQNPVSGTKFYRALLFQ
jgi:sugar lactone lactonase YvrE